MKSSLDNARRDRRHCSSLFPKACKLSNVQRALFVLVAERLVDLKLMVKLLLKIFLSIQLNLVAYDTEMFR